MGVLKLRLGDHEVVVGVHGVVLEDHLVLQLLLDDVDDEESPVVRHHHQVLLRVERDQAPLVPLRDPLDYFIRRR